MTILQLCSKPPYPATDGGSIAISAIIQGFSDFGHSVTILSVNTPKHNTKIETISNLLPVNTLIKLINVNTRIKFFKGLKNFIISKKPYHIERFTSKNFEAALELHLQKQKFDIVQVEGLYVSSYIPIVKKFSDAIICYRSHNVESEIWERIAAAEKNILKKYYLLNLAKRLKRFEKSIVNTYSVLLPITERDAQVFAAFGNIKPVHIVPVGIKANKINVLDTILYPTVCYIGALDWIPNQKGLIWFIDKVWPLISKQKPEIQLFIAGRNAPDRLVKKFIIKNINYLGEVNDAHEFLNKYAIMIVPLFSGSGMRVKIIEGLFLGKAIVSTSIGAEGIEITDRKDILIADNPEKFANSILELTLNKEFYDEICINARNLALNKYDNNQIINNLLNFIGSL